MIVNERGVPIRCDLCGQGASPSGKLDMAIVEAPRDVSAFESMCAPATSFVMPPAQSFECRDRHACGRRQVGSLIEHLTREVKSAGAQAPDESGSWVILVDEYVWRALRRDRSDHIEWADRHGWRAGANDTLWLEGWPVRLADLPEWQWHVVTMPPERRWETPGRLR